MKIFTETFLLTTAIFLHHFVKLISSEPRTTADLFPGYRDVMPPVEIFPYEGDLPKFNSYFSERFKFIPKLLAKRGHIIFGWYFENFILDLFRTFSDLEPEFFVFDMNKNERVTVPHDLSQKLGAGRHYELVLAYDEAVAIHLSTSNNPVYKEADIRGYTQANDRVPIVEKEQDKLLRDEKTTIEEAVMKIKQEYSDAYDREFTRYLHQHGEYNVHGHRVRDY